MLLLAKNRVVLHAYFLSSGSYSSGYGMEAHYNAINPRHRRLASVCQKYRRYSAGSFGPLASPPCRGFMLVVGAEMECVREFELALDLRGSFCSSFRIGGDRTPALPIADAPPQWATLRGLGGDCAWCGTRREKRRCAARRLGMNCVRTMRPPLKTFDLRGS